MTEAFHKAYYEARSFWADGALTDAANLRRLSESERMIPEDCRTLLDVGCGNGVFGTLVRQRRPELSITGIDRSEEALKHTSFPTGIASADKLPFGDNAFDCVSCLQVIEHLPQGGYERTLGELLRVARRWIIIGVPFKEDLRRALTTCPSCRSSFNSDFHLRSFDMETLSALFPQDAARLDATNLPARTTRRWLIDDAIRHLDARLRPPPAFLSPICPVCGYSEGDRTSLSVARTNGLPASKPASTARRLARAGLGVLDRVWPRVEVDGYWVISRYRVAKRAAPSSTAGR